MFRCENCRSTFDEPIEITETHGFSDGRYENFLACPICGAPEMFEEVDEEDD